MKKVKTINVFFGFLITCLIIFGTGCKSSHYLSKIRKPDISLADTIKEFTSFEREDFVQMETLLKSAREKAIKSEFMKNIHETIFLLVDSKVAFTVIIKGNEISIDRGRKKETEATLLVPFTTSIAKNLDDVLLDYKLDQAEIFNISYILFMPCLNRMYSMPYLYKTHMFKGKLDNFLQFVIKNPEGYTYHGQKIVIGATVVNVDGMFLTFPGLTGDPDIRLELSLDQAMEIYKFIAYDAVQEQSNAEKMRLFNKYSDLVKKCTVYERKWH